MESPEFDKVRMMKYWIDSSDDDFEAMLTLFDNNHYSWSLFIGHLMIEKLLKALFVNKYDNYPPVIHNLLELAENCNIVLTEEQREFFMTLTDFKAKALYDDSIMSFQKTCTPDFAAIWIQNLLIQRKWIKQLIEY